MPGYIPEEHDALVRQLVAEHVAESKMPDRLKAVGVVISWRKLKEHLVRLGLARTHETTEASLSLCHGHQWQTCHSPERRR